MPTGATSDESDDGGGPMSHSMLLEEALAWLADATLVVHTGGEPRVVPSAPDANEMWELGKLCSERIGLFVQVCRVARRHGCAPRDHRERHPDSHFALGGNTMRSWDEVMIFEAVVGPFFRLFYESFMPSADAELGALAQTLWRGSQSFIRFGQARVSREMARGERVGELQLALDKWLPLTLELLDEVPDQLDLDWRLAGLRTRSNEQVRSDYTEEIATYLRAAELDVPLTCSHEIQEVDVRWVGEEVAAVPKREDRLLRPATFAFSERTTGRGTAAAPSATTPEPSDHGGR